MTRLLLSLALVAAPLASLCAQPAQPMSCCDRSCPSQQDQAVCCGETPAAAVPLKAVVPQPAVLVSAAPSVVASSVERLEDAPQAAVPPRRAARYGGLSPPRA